MANHRAWRQYPANIAPERFSLNGRVPNPAGWRGIANGYNFVSSYMRKQVLSYCWDVQSIPASAGGTNAYLYFPFRTGENVSKLVAMLGVAPADSASTPDPSVRLRAVPASPGSVVTGDWTRYYRIDTTSTFTPDKPQDVQWVRTSIDLSSNTLYRGAIDVASNAKLWAATVWEEAPLLADDSVTGVCDPAAFEAYGPIRSEDIQDVITTGTKLWQHNGGHLFSWSSKGLNSVSVDNTAPGSNWTNVLNLTSTSVTANTPGWVLSTAFMDSVSNNVPLEMGVYATRISGTGTLEVRLRSASGTLASVTGIAGTMDPFVTATTSTAATSSGGTKFDLQCRVVGTALFYLEAVGLWLYES